MRPRRKLIGPLVHSRHDVNGDGTMSALEFARYLTTYVPTQQQKGFLEHASAMEAANPNMPPISFEEFCAFCDVVDRYYELEVRPELLASARYDSLLCALWQTAVHLVTGTNMVPARRAVDASSAAPTSAAVKTSLTEAQLLRVLSVLSERRNDISERLATTIFRIFDQNGDGSLDETEFLSLMKTQHSHGLQQVRTRAPLAAAQ